MKERQKIMILLCILAAALAAFFGLSESKKSPQRGKPNEQQTVLTKVTGEVLSKISYTYHKSQITLVYERGNWVLANDYDLPLNLDIPTRMADIVTTLTSIRTVDQSVDKADYGINNSAIKVMVEGKDGSSYGFTIGSYVDFTQGTYVMLDGDETIYFISGEIGKAFSYQSADFVLMPPVPKIENIHYLCVDSPTKRFEAFRDAKNEEWYSLVNGEQVALHAINARATAGMLSRLEWFGCADEDVTEDEMARYGLDKPVTVTVRYADGDHVTRSFTLCIGSVEGSKYYARLPGSSMVLLIQGELVSPLLPANLERLRASP